MGFRDKRGFKLQEEYIIFQTAIRASCVFEKRNSSNIINNRRPEMTDKRKADQKFNR